MKVFFISYTMTKMSLKKIVNVILYQPYISFKTDDDFPPILDDGAQNYSQF